MALVASFFSERRSRRLLRDVVGVFGRLRGFRRPRRLRGLRGLRGRRFRCGGLRGPGGLGVSFAGVGGATAAGHRHGRSLAGADLAAAGVLPGPSAPFPGAVSSLRFPGRLLFHGPRSGRFGFHWPREDTTSRRRAKGRSVAPGLGSLSGGSADDTGSPVKIPFRLRGPARGRPRGRPDARGRSRAGSGPPVRSRPAPRSSPGARRGSRPRRATSPA